MDHQAAHGGRSALHKMALRPILADRLPLALPHAQPANELWSNQQAQKQRRRHRRSRRSEEHTSELQSLMRISYAVFCLKKKNTTNHKLKEQRITTRYNNTN